MRFYPASIVSLLLVTTSWNDSSKISAQSASTRNARRRFRSTSSASGCRSCTDNNGMIETETLEAEDSGSNDGSFLEYLCNVFVQYQGRNCTVDGLIDGNLDKLLCPNSYEQDKICYSKDTIVDGNLTLAIESEYCVPLFSSLTETLNKESCVSLCNDYLNQDAKCCQLDC